MTRQRAWLLPGRAVGSQPGLASSVRKPGSVGKCWEVLILFLLDREPVAAQQVCLHVSPLLFGSSADGASAHAAAGSGAGSTRSRLSRGAAQRAGPQRRSQQSASSRRPWPPCRWAGCRRRQPRRWRGPAWRRTCSRRGSRGGLLKKHSTCRMLPLQGHSMHGIRGRQELHGEVVVQQAHVPREVPLTWPSGASHRLRSQPRSREWGSWSWQTGPAQQHAEGKATPDWSRKLGGATVAGRQGCMPGRVVSSAEASPPATPTPPSRTTYPCTPGER